ncbi:hypothetical protein ACLK1S_07585 [Escherichia coli]
MPCSHRELAREVFPETKAWALPLVMVATVVYQSNLFNSRRIDAIDVTTKTEPHP